MARVAREGGGQGFRDRELAASGGVLGAVAGQFLQLPLHFDAHRRSALQARVPTKYLKISI